MVFNSGVVSVFMLRLPKISGSSITNVLLVIIAIAHIIYVWVDLRVFKFKLSRFYFTWSIYHSLIL